MSKGIHITETPRPIRAIGTILIIGTLIGYCGWSIMMNERDPVYNSDVVESIVEEWKQDINSMGIDADTELKTVDQILVVDSIPYGFLNSGHTKEVMGRSDLGSRSVWILKRPMKRDQLKALIYHELGHYVFQLNHEGTGEIMSTYIKEDSGYYKRNWNRLLPIYLNKCKRHG
tara:strand:- start:85 stop:603 length:519 start_codon:yes stop_codon:yes gene_type:complete